ncbi:Hypothetical predicted protein [Pelobates cultripes]|uniref:P2X purinoreceptor 7 intracellular domain-containing protein n=1 Tax=Pelobates cultripes TaxID=61616 RepID=A0AAD1R7T8_PELCU|nr:Hypothetical predicted protein [Pelobates cultripes]
MASGHDLYEDEETQRMRRRSAAVEATNPLGWDPLVENDRDASVSTATPSVPSRIGTSEWCLCGNCVPMPTEEENVCCREIEKMQEMIAADKSCISQLEYLEQDIVSREHILCLYRFGASFGNRRIKSPEEML